MPRGSNDRANSSGGGGGGGGNNNNNNNRKKFGKNLNRMVKPAAPPPIPNDKADRNARNGLLLLSTKKQSTGLLASKTNATISGNNNNGISTVGAHAGTTKLNLQSNPSTHDVLLSAVVGASQVDSQQKLDAWGVADSQMNEKQLQQPPSEPNDNNVEEHHHENRNNNSNNKDAYYEDDENPFLDPEFEQPKPRQGDSRDGAGQAFDATGTSWDEYGGRGRSNGTNGTLVETDTQGAYMSQLAKERAQIKRKEEEARVAEQKAKAAQRLHELERKKAGGEGTSGATTTTTTRTLWEPEDAKKNGNHNKNNNSNNRKQQTNGKDSNKSSGKSAVAENAAPDTDETKLIHLASYEDRDRGEQRGAAAAPRMLFDPKSGSMVEVKAKSESSGGAGGKPSRKDRRAKANNNNNSANHKKDSTPETSTKNGRNKQKGRNKDSEKKKANPNRRFPRTCGVLYKRDGKGNLRSADGCDGDLGLASHSVPGGRIRNPDAFQVWGEQNPQSAFVGVPQNDAARMDYASDKNNTTGFSLESSFGAEDPQPVMEWVKADEKIELVTGVDDSPTLKPTAKEFAPSEAALAAAAAAATSGKDSADEASTSLADGVPEETDEEKEEEVASREPEEDGLGFDPLQGIDFMTSPTNNTKTPEEIATVDLPALALDPPMFSGTTGVVEDTSVSRPLFGFNTSGTWGNGQAVGKGGNVTDWGSSGSAAAAADGIGIFGSDVFGKNEKESEPAPFLATGASSTWGPSTVPGLDRLPAINAPNHATGPAD